MVIMNNVNTTERLIQEVRARPPLWDQRNLNYHNRIVVNALWQDIADLLQVNKETVKVKWKGLRDTYRRELKKQRNNANVNNIGETVRDPSWTHYSSMNFLREYMGNNNSHTDLFQFHGWSTDDIPPDESLPSDETFNSFVSPNSIVDLVPSKIKEESISGDETTKTELRAESHSVAENEKPNSPFRKPNVKKNNEKKKSGTRLSRLKEHRLRTKLSRKRPKMHRITHQPTNLHEDSDDDLYFFKSLIPYVKNLPPTRKLFLRSEIHNLILREIMSDNSSHSVIPLEHVTVGLNG